MAPKLQESADARTTDLERSPFVSQSGGMLVVVEGPDQGKSLRVRGGPLFVGGAASCDLALSDDAVSRRHLRVMEEADAVTVRDLGSTNGSFVHSTRFREISLAYGTELRIGRSSLRYLPYEEAVEPEASPDAAFGSLLGRSVQMRRLFRLLADVSKHPTTVLIEGETGTGKERVAEELHRHSPRSEAPFVVFDCASVPRELMGSALFGHIKGSFTGAVADRIGAFAQAQGGTIFLDEIGELPSDLQPTLLRALEQRAVCRIGATNYEKVDVRIVAASNRNLREEVAAGRFRADLYYRLAVIRIRMPPLRDRLEDIPVLAEGFARQFGYINRPAFGPEAIAALERHRWAGNVRELRNVVERATVLSGGGPLQLTEDMFDEPDFAPKKTGPRDARPFKEAKEEFVRRYIADLLSRHSMNISAAAREAGIDRKYLRELIRKYGAEEPPAESNE